MIESGDNDLSSQPAPMVSIGIAVYNAQGTLADTIRSVFAQTFTDWELILADDSSTDDSLAIARSVADPRVRVLTDSVNRGQAFRHNQVTAQARGKYLARLDADDLMHPERLARQVAFLEANPQVELIGTGAYTIDEANEPLGVRGLSPPDVRPAAVLKHSLFIHPSVMGRIEWFRRHPYDPAYVRSEDHELWCRTCQNSVFAALPEPLVFYRESRSGNLSNYLRTAATDRKILRTYGPATIGRWRTVLLVMRSHLKGALYAACTRLGLQGRLIARRNRALAAAEIAQARAALEGIRQTQVPGWGPAKNTNGERDYEVLGKPA
ncbi:MAG TPA: glycosyltransferase family 2 protein [Gemmataceae bacterium]|nr:glycosyltransferase family 2 protein [Gemmataceae bacterium]